MHFLQDCLLEMSICVKIASLLYVKCLGAARSSLSPFDLKVTVIHYVYAFNCFIFTFFFLQYQKLVFEQHFELKKIVLNCKNSRQKKLTSTNR